MNHNRTLVILIVANLFIIGAAAMFINEHTQKAKAQYEEELKVIHDKYRFKLDCLAHKIAYHQAKIGHGTYLTMGKPKGHEPVSGYPRCNLGCCVITYNEIELQRNFLNSYNNALLDFSNEQKDRANKPDTGDGK